MKILVCISHVPDTTSKINFKNDNTEFDTAGLQFVINPYDEFGLTRAIWLKEKFGGTVTAINVGTNATEPTLRKALAIGADDAIRVDAEPRDSFFVAKQLAKVIFENEYDIVICGQESIDYNGGQVPGMVAALLKMPFVNACVGLEIEGQTATCTREIDGGKEVLKAQLPIVIGGKKGLVEEKDLRIPNMRGIMSARTKPLNVVQATEAPSMTESVKYQKPAPKAAVKMIDKDNVQELVELLHSEAKVI
ncbi:MAG: electron transfer flavoprotein subunit beta/FixA family protein [Bacteroidota bacterium]|nr:electron transfer flavoprotein subunit beta/FixA family protein [Bacteroidota bacterium]MDX5404643.1 electron transfer flavoprotein subunit beta/FixA family protein [Bacteroidota bacterium]MDX5426796.1 electron transfer flavoprotein subunit beta/FixA family protein [Bacteroidota bacterium]MDX5447917.1 electron transfer flavoprotein subunit beta/FixA family protein [Bacteroidota bacterium]MDX5504782.1 electron transfer flavoprotein subunit beta/FixA family protein [Bacteroidota bacterium]